MGKVMVIDITKCNGCHNCQIACKDEHCGNDWSPIAAPQPLTGQFWHKVKDKVRGQVPKVKVAYEHYLCQQCDDAPCLKACPSKAIYKRPDGAVIIDPTKCKGSHNCVRACPYGNVIFFNEDLRIAQKCTFCAHLLDQGWTTTRCAEVCPTGAITFGEETELADLIARAEPLRPELAVGPRVYYIGIPKTFIGGTVFDPDADEVIEQAVVTLARVGDGPPKKVFTDEFGDFWVDGLERGVYNVFIEKEGYVTLQLPVVTLDKDVTLGDLAMIQESK
jgi:Fe-S-cluster-containing dehydrogenase component